MASFAGTSVCAEKKEETRDVQVESQCLESQRVKEIILGQTVYPVVFTDMVHSWVEALSWTPNKLADLLSGISTTFKVSPKNTQTQETVYETECIHVTATYQNLCEWLDRSTSKGKQKQKRSSPLLVKEQDDVPVSSDCKRARTGEEYHDVENPLLIFSREHFWVYADYKYMSELCMELPHVREAVDWSVFGFKDRDGQQSTLWVGSEGAYTPCHFDTYGCNLVAQLYGCKRWTLFPPSSTPSMYPTRLPFEESSVFSQVNITNPDLTKHPRFSNAHKYEVLLEPGQVLFVPRHWWHYVECMSTAVSVNTWIELPEDDEERVKEALTRVMVCALKGAEAVDLNAAHVTGESGILSRWLNPGEEVFAHLTNLRLVAMAMDGVAKGDSPGNSSGHTSLSSLSEEQQSDLLINCVADRRVVELLAQILKEKMADIV